MSWLLEKEVAKLVESGRHVTPLVPKQSRVEIPRQLDFFDTSFGMSEQERAQGNLLDLNASGIRKCANTITLATFYELLTTGLYGGRMFNHLYVLARDGSVVRRESNLSLNGFATYEPIITLVKPDIIDQEHHWVGEVKAYRSGKHYKLRDNQMAGYVKLQQTMPSETSIDYIIYRHTVHDFPSSSKHLERRYSDEELFSALAQRTAHSIILPFNLVYLLHTIRGDSDWVYRDEGKIEQPKTEFGSTMQFRDPGTCLRSQSANKILVDPEGFLEAQHLNLNDYEIERLRAPDDFYFGDFRVTPFPITLIRYKHYKEWAQRLRQPSPSVPVDISEEPDTLDFNEEAILASRRLLEERVDDPF